MVEHSEAHFCWGQKARFRHAMETGCNRAAVFPSGRPRVELVVRELCGAGTGTPVPQRFKPAVCAQHGRTKVFILLAEQPIIAMLTTLPHVQNSQTDGQNLPLPM